MFGTKFFQPLISKIFRCRHSMRYFESDQKQEIYIRRPIHSLVWGSSRSHCFWFTEFRAGIRTRSRYVCNGYHCCYLFYSVFAGLFFELLAFLRFLTNVRFLGSNHSTTIESIKSGKSRRPSIYND